MATDKPTPQPKHPSGPPRPPHPMPSPTIDGIAAATKPTTPITPTVPIPAPPTSETEPDIPKHTTAHPDTDPPTFPQQITHTIPTNTEILADTDLFNTHISEIDSALNIYPFSSKSAPPQKETAPFNALKRAWKKEAPIWVFLMETKLSTDQLNAKKQNRDYNQGLVVSNEGQSGGLALLWKPANVRKLGLSLNLSVKQITFPGFASVISMRLQASLRKRVVAYGQHAKWIVFALPFTIVVSLTLDMLALHSHGPETTLLKVVFISGWTKPWLT
uniref:Uncharacterized protein n=1 Tax=Quercus lobata TaxID=97700 RepID=A0A7N2LL92_QUELO